MKKPVSILIAVLIFALSVSCAKQEDKEEPEKEAAAARTRPGLILFTIDTCRADRLQSYGYRDIQTDAESALAGLGTSFNYAVTPVPLTLPSHASILTGNYPPVHGVRDNGMFKLKGDSLTLAEVLQSSGYRTGAFVGSFVLDSQFGLDQGFDVYDDDPASMERADHFLFAERKAETVGRRALDWIMERNATKKSDKPYFAWLHFFDPHQNYSPPPPFDSAYEDRPYDGEIAYVDSVIGQFLDVLNSGGKLENTLIILTSDHGESLGEHGEQTHGLFLYDSTMRVPLIMVMEGVIPQSTRVHNQVRLIDIFPTVLELFGIPPVETDGVSLVPAFAGNIPPATKAAYMESHMPKYTYNWNPVKALRTDDWKYIRSEKEELYLLETDFWESRNVLDENKETAAELSKMMDEITEGMPRNIESIARMDAETEQKLRSLGYLGGGRRIPERGMSKEDMLSIMSALSMANNLVSSGKTGEAVEIIEKVIARDPGNVDAFNMLGKVLLNNGEYERAAEYLIRALELSIIFNPSLHLNLAQCYEATDDLKKALEQAELVIGKVENHTEAHLVAGRIYLKLNRYFDAREHLTRAVELKGDLYEARVLLSRLYLETGKYEDVIEHAGRIIDDLGPAGSRPPLLSAAYTASGMALKELGKKKEAEYFFKEALDISPSHPRALIELGKLLLEEDRSDELSPYLQTYLDSSPELAPSEKREIRELMDRIEASS